jgi:hypothetical protein
MSLIYIDGFDHYGTADIGKKGWVLSGPSSTSAASIAPTAGRRGGGAVKFTSSPDLHLNKAVNNLSTVTMGFAYKTTGSGNQDILTLKDTTTHQVTLSVTNTGLLQVYRGNGLSFSGSGLLGQSTQALPLGSWNYIELKATIAPSGGAVEVRVNGAAWITVGSANTSSTGTNRITTVALGTRGQANSGGNDFWYDDFYLCDTAGTVNNTFLGDCRVDTLRPTANGTSAVFTPSNGTGPNWQLVDEAVLDTTDYVSGTGGSEIYQFSDLTGTPSQVFGVQVAAAVAKDDAGTRTVATMVWNGATGSAPAGVPISTDYAYVMNVWEQTATSGGVAWTVSAVNAAQFGVFVS